MLCTVRFMPMTTAIGGDVDDNNDNNNDIVNTKCLKCDIAFNT